MSRTTNTGNRRIYLAGAGMGMGDTVTTEVSRLIQESSCLIGAARLVKPYLDLGKEIVAAYKPEDIRNYIDSHEELEQITVLLSGDSGFYSGAKNLLAALAGFDVTVLPGISSVSYFAAKIQQSWEDAALLSMHGISQNFIDTVVHRKKTFVLFGSREQAEEVCEKLRYYGLSHLIFHIGKNLSGPEETVVSRKASELTPEDLEGLCIACVVNEKPKERHFHLRDEEFLRGEVPMTKEEIRLISIGKLGLSKNDVVYDVGAGTGSVSVEMALQIPGGRVFAVEKNPEGIGLIRANKKKFCADNLKVVEGTAPEVLSELPKPTHVFIGGSSGNLREIVDCVRRKNPEVKIVMNLITLENLSTVCQMAQEGILKEEHLEITQIAASRSRKLGAYHGMTGLNPIYIVTC